MARLGSYDEVALADLRTLFVSRAPQRRNGGAVHKDTIYAQPVNAKKEGKVVRKIALSVLKDKDLDNLVEPHRNVRLYQAIRDRLAAFGGKADKAFAPDNPFYKPSRDGVTQGPRVTSVKVLGSETGIPIRGGLAKNDSMLRVDVFAKAGKFHLVPVYVHHRVSGLPNRAIVAFKDEEEWTLIDNSFEFLFSLYPNDFIKVQQKGKPAIAGYFGSAHRGTGAVSVWLHDRSTALHKMGAIEGIGVKTALILEKFNVDVLGRIYPAPAEPRRGLA
jgi:CRISPR-associated endonuclease Csn1